METRNCHNCKKDFTVESEDFAFYEKLGVPAPTWCSLCRLMRRLTFINARSLYKRVCGNCNKPIISMYHDDTGISAWCIKCHLSDKWDGRDYGRDYDFSKNFFQQFKELKRLVPHRALDQNERNGEGCEYSNYCFTCKDAYLCFDVAGTEHAKYSAHVFKGNKNIMDSLIIKDSDRVYEFVQSNGSFNSSFLIESDQCIESHFLFDCSNCTSCCLSSNLRNKSYVFKNKQLTKEEYKKAIESLRLDTYTGQLKAKEVFEEIAKNSIRPYAHIKNSVNAVGDFIENSKDVYRCYGLISAENVKNVFYAMNSVKDSQDLIFTGKLEECYEVTHSGRGGNKIVFTFSSGGGSKNLFYCDSCRGCSDCFGCVGLTKKQYCILNKQYTKEEYQKLLPKVIQHLDDLTYVDKAGRRYGFGELFPSEISPFAYNESSAYEEFPLSKSEVLSLGYKWRDPEAKSYSVTIESKNLPDGISEVKDDICSEVIGCPNEGKIELQCTFAYRILPDELQFYRQMGLPLPRYCPNCRYHDRLKWKNPFRFYKRQCMCDLPNHSHKAKCPNEFETMYSPERSEKIYCKTCYQKEVY